MLFMGQEWAASSPFQFFTDHNEELGRAVTEGRRSEFGAWDAFRNEALRDRIPDPQELTTFTRSRLDWAERETSPHRGVLALYQQLLHLRSTEPALRWTEEAIQHAMAPDEDTVVVHRRLGEDAMLLMCRLRGGPATIGTPSVFEPPPGYRWGLVLTTEGADYTDESLPIEATDAALPECTFARPGAALFRAQPEAQ
jgi:maltooligosyltrehalose trehalohydrolase